MVSAAMKLKHTSYDKPRQHIKKQRHYFSDKGPSGQSYGFSSSHIWMWELDYKESWALKNWFFWTVALKTLRVPWTSRRSNQSILKEISPGISLEEMMLKLTEKAMAPHSSTLAWKNPRTEEPGRLQSMGLHRVGHDWATSLSLFTFTHWRRKWRPTPVFLPGESQGRGNLVGCRPWGHTELDTTEVT